MCKKWIAFFSQTGTEIVDISLYFNRWPDVIYTDSDYSNHHPIIRNENRNVVYILQQDTKQLNILNQYDPETTLITLHGWLHIVPKKWCDTFTIYNGHPGLITKYPELKGRDPQQKVIDNMHKYNTIGSVIHRVTSIVDGGDVLNKFETSLDQNNTPQDVFYKLKHTSFYSWINFLQPILTK